MGKGGRLCALAMGRSSGEGRRGECYLAWGDALSAYRRSK
ncbi:hypothetical protein HMPREF9080_01309 [Cardiobacterium valvarum F0432]|uniref:Uncharacterized protein n=1 Tax=Cardiobacterium valvarum F0432 TaxID=797473 RepID=G9ZEW9_9GAMM|nr:hypothetical protein HMPREF9080_01309 [Cardiobacterium valvarum F0432]